jgi:hypothetical protein
MSYRATRHPLLVEGTVIGILVAFFVIPGLWFAVLGDATLLVIGLVLTVPISLWLLWFLVVELRLDGGELRWFTALRSGRIPLDELTAVRASRSNVMTKLAVPTVRLQPRGADAVFEATGGRSVSVSAHKGLVPFLQALAAGRPGLSIDVPARWERLEHWPGRSHFDPR